MALDAKLKEAERPGLLPRKTSEASGPGVSGCWLSGAPTLPAEVDWPVYEETGLPTVPMHFIAQLDLGQLPNRAGLPPMPDRGTLFFFYDTIFAPTSGMGATGSKVIYLTEDVSETLPRAMPPMPDVANHELTSHWYADAPTAGYRQWRVTFGDVLMTDEALYPEEQFWRAASGQNMAEHERLSKLTRRDRGRSGVPGWSSQFAMHRMFGDTMPGLSLAGGEWVTLLTVEGDDDLLFTHGDRVPIAFLIQKTDLANGAFERVYITERYG